MSWRFRFRKSIPILPVLRLNLSRTGISWTWHLGRRLSWNSRTHNTSVDTPGPGSFVHRGHPGGQRGHTSGQPRRTHTDRWTDGSLD